MMSTNTIQTSWRFIKDVLINPTRLPIIAAIIILIEIILNVFIIEKVPYTEIDWVAYMQECEGVLNGTLDYSKLRGDTGPLVYPAGFVYIYSILYYLTDRGQDIKFAQYAFLVIYILQLLFVLRVYIKSRKVPPYVLLFTILTSYRIHSIYVLRLFNDPIAVLLFYISLNLFLDGKWYLGSVFYSLAVSVKMNILLYAPALFFFYLVNLGFKLTLRQLLTCAFVQFALGMPFLITYPVSYIKGSFDIGRVFNHTWTVNYRFLGIDTFESRCFHLSLLVVHLILLISFYPMCIKYFKSYCRLRYVQNHVQPQINAKNLENRKKHKGFKSKEHGKKTVKTETMFTEDQAKFLESFESMLKKSSKDSKLPAPVQKPEPIYSINFDVLSQLVILPFFISNFIGIMCARSLHYQFYSWYFHSLPYLVWNNNYSIKFRFLLFALIEFCWNTYPSTVFSSLMLHACHISILFGVYMKFKQEIKTAKDLI